MKYKSVNHSKEQYISERKGKKGYSFEVVIPYKDATDKRCYYTETVKVADHGSAAEALQAAKDIRDKQKAKLLENNYVKKTPTIEDLYQRSLEFISASEKTKDRHSAYYNALVPENDRKREILEVKTSDWQLWLNTYAETHSQPLVNRALGIIRNIYDATAKLELPIADKSKALTVPRSKVPVKRRQTETSKTDFKKFCEYLLAYNKNDKTALIHNQNIWYGLQLEYYLGLRPQEAFAITEEAIDLKKGFVTPQYSVGSTAKKKRQLIELKTGDISYRSIPIPAPVRPVLVELLKRKTEPLILDLDGLPYDVDFVSNYIYRIAKARGVSFNQYRLRHLFSTDLFREKVNPKTIQRLMGHSSENMSLYYAFSTEKEQKAAMAIRSKKIPTKSQQIEVKKAI